MEGLPIDQASAIWNDIQRIRADAPLVHNITNYVVMNTTANALLALGASPVMAHAEEEVADMAAIAGALVINMGTLSRAWIHSMFLAGRAAHDCRKPVVFDPVGAGATRFRTETAHRLLGEFPIAVIRGNASEIRALCTADHLTKGVDSVHSSEDALDAAHALADKHNCVVSVSGAVDLIVSAGAVIRVRNGHPMMPRVTGLGCTASALTGAFAAVNPSPLHAAAHAMAVMGIAGELAIKDAHGPGTFQVRFLDSLYLIREADIRERLQMEQE
ncbi:MAG TPA: hydroxyethylthiazole kinase [Bryobacteraceae bacterium]|nr:hydroxyethylthiazole kinase [Bryobacteraceae bacterium]